MSALRRFVVSQGAMVVPLAHAGHWLPELIYVVPVLAVVGWIGFRSLMDRRRGDVGGDEPPAAS